MDWSLILGVIGILVSIVVGWVTFRLTERRARNQRHSTAKATVLQELSKSLGEDSVPTPATIEATLRSVVRETADPKLNLSIDEILDDLTRQVTSDPFLDAERRRKLQGDIEKVREQARDHGSHGRRQRFDRDFSAYSRTYFQSRFSSTALSLLTTVASLIAVFGLTTRDADFRKQLEGLDSGAATAVAAGVLVVFVAVTFVNVLGDDLVSTVRRWFSKRSDKDE